MNSTIKPKIFIGSSQDGIKIANFVEKELSDIAECNLWTLHFDYNKSYLSELEGKLALFDYGIFIASGDDIKISKKKKRVSARDNIIFEFGLFIGRLGRERTFLLAERGVDLPSDLHGNKLPYYVSLVQAPNSKILSDATMQRKQKESLKNICSKIKDLIVAQTKQYEFSYFPSAVLAYGYFHNFLEKSIRNLLHTKTVQIGDLNKAKSYKLKPEEKLSFKDVEIKVFIPDDIASDMFDKVREIKHTRNLDIIKVDSGGDRPFDFSIELKKLKNKQLILTDIPLTLNSLNEAITEYTKKHAIRDIDARRIIEEREIKIFMNTLTYLISKNSLTKKRVKVELVDI